MLYSQVKHIVVTGARGFIGTNLILRLSEIENIAVHPFDMDDSEEDLLSSIDTADIVFHLAGVNRPKDIEDFERGNVGLTERIVSRVKSRKNSPAIVVTSSIQAELDNPYGLSKRKAEQVLFQLQRDTDVELYVYRLPNVFGKWSRPFYNSAVATFCFQVAQGEKPSIHNPDASLLLVYIDDVIDSFLRIVTGGEPVKDGDFYQISPEFKTTVGEVAGIIESFSRIRENNVFPDFSSLLQKYLYSTYLSHVPTASLGYRLDRKSDDRGYLCELIKSNVAGQIFISRTKPGITRGNHYHHTKVEKFFVIDGTAEVKIRHMISGEVRCFRVEGTECRAIDIPPGYTHQIINVGTTDLLTLFWANELFDPNNPDTYFSKV